MKPIYSFDKILDIVNVEIKNIGYDDSPQSLFAPIAYILSVGGKRIRPALALMACNLYNEDIAPALPVALGIEVFHNFTLLHDDLMDKAEMRRGKPSVHIKWDDNTAILSGDAMLTEAYRLMAKVDAKYLPRILDLFSHTATEIYTGQQYDMEFEQRMDVTEPEYIEMIRLKTAVLLGCALKQGAIVTDAPEADMKNLYDFGINIGLGFQLKDDLLDVYGDPKTFGKKIGGDILCNKKTFLLINALADDSVKDELQMWINKTSFEEAEKINAVRNIYDKLNLKQKSEELIKSYSQKAIACLDLVQVAKERKQELYFLADSLISRNS